MLTSDLVRCSQTRSSSIPVSSVVLSPPFTNTLLRKSKALVIQLLEVTNWPIII
jgi:hypothetical protein